MKRNTHEGSRFDDFLKDEGIYEDVEAAAVKKVIATMLAEAMKAQNISKVAMVKRIGTSRSQLDRLLDPENASVTLVTLTKAAAAIGKRLKIAFEDDHGQVRATAKIV
ncbi:MAG: helix-turn-helix transcriptional regulator [Rhodocyclales bacterium]|nr:helix-turn-helix transcriptional regulator [Rhodocyclales bacterium]